MESLSCSRTSKGTFDDHSFVSRRIGFKCPNQTFKRHFKLVKSAKLTPHHLITLTPLELHCHDHGHTNTWNYIAMTIDTPIHLCQSSYLDRNEATEYILGVCPHENECMYWTLRVSVEGRHQLNNTMEREGRREGGRERGKEREGGREGGRE